MKAFKALKKIDFAIAVSWVAMAICIIVAALLIQQTYVLQKEANFLAEYYGDLKAFNEEQEKRAAETREILATNPSRMTVFSQEDQSLYYSYRNQTVYRVALGEKNV